MNKALLKKQLPLVVSALLASLWTFPAVTFAQTQSDDAPSEGQQAQEGDDEAVNLATIQVVGSRRGQTRSAADSPVPIDVLKTEDLQGQGSSDIIDVLPSIVPSLNANREPISDAGTLVRPVNLRALPSDHTLVLVNGKRRHRGAVVGEFISGVNKGAQGVDVYPLFGTALAQVEVLRDGAAAQYGSDAIAGVINYQLLNDPEVRNVNLQYGEAYEGDGQTLELSGAFGAPLGEFGFMTIAFQAKDQDDTSRGVQDGIGSGGGAAGLAAAGFPVPDPAVIWGQPEVKEDYNLVFNSGIPIGETELYGFGTYGTRDVDGSFYYRNPVSRQGVFATGPNALFGDLTGAGGCPVGPLPTTSLAAAQAFIASAPANCFSFFSQFPGGFTPRFGGLVIDRAVTAGWKGTLDNGFGYDFSVGYGKNDVGYRIRNTVNASLGPASPNDFDLGSQNQSEVLFNADFVYPISVGLASDLNIAFGLQYQDEAFEITAGDLASYQVGPLISQGFSAGSNGFQGFSDTVAGQFERDSIGAYLDVEADITERFLLSGAVRFEDFSDFGNTTNGKLSALFRLSESFALRGSASTGFRAPTLGQSNLQRSATAFSGGQLIETLVIASTDPIAQFFGGGQLDPEESRNFSIGLTTAIGPVSITADYFDIRVDDRIAQLSQTITPEQRAQLIALGITEAATISTVQFFTNDFDTKTRGLDIVAIAPFSSSFGDTRLTLAYNHNETTVTNPGTTVSAGRRREIEDALPANRLTLGATHEMGNFNGLIRVNYYDEAFENLFNDETIPVVTDPLTMVDIEFGWKFAENFRLAVGAKNVFDEYPDEWSLADGSNGRTPGFLGAIYPLNHPAGFNGGSYYVRLSSNF